MDAIWKIRISFPILLLICVSFIYKTICTSIDDPITFTQNTSGWLHVDPDFGSEDEDIVYNTPETRLKLCYYAARVAAVRYIDYNCERGWQGYIPNSIIPEYHYAMDCVTLPSVHVLLHCDETTLEIRTFSRALMEQYDFDGRVIEASSVTAIIKDKEDDKRSKDQKKSDERMAEEGESAPSSTSEDDDQEEDVRRRISPKDDFDKIDSEERRHLCLSAVEYLLFPIRFLDFYASEVQMYEFQDVLSTEKSTHLAIACPTLPKLYLRLGEPNHTLTKVLLRGLIDQVEFEAEVRKPTSIARVDEDTETRFEENRLWKLDQEDRMNLCALARKDKVFSHVPFVEDEKVIEAHLYTFKYVEQEVEIREVAILCPAIPSMYLAQHNIENKVKIIFPQTPADRYVYNVELVAAVDTLTTSDELQQSTSLQQKIVEQTKQHPFTIMGRENCWNVCWAAQKNILNDSQNRYNFRFTENEPVLADFKLLLIPEYMKEPEMYKITYTNGERETDTIIRCSEWPKMFVRLGKSDNEIKIMLQQLRYFVK